MIELREVTKKFGNFTAVDGINLKIQRGEILGLLGPNGAGKTTTMRMITGFFPQTSGEIKIDGMNLIEEPIKLREKIGYLPESNPLYTDMRVYEYLEYVAKLKKIFSPREKAVNAMEKTGLAEMRKRIIGKLSKGYRQRVGIAQALINEPEILILDEPTVGLDPRQIQEIRNLIRGFAREHTVILSTHILPEVEITCDRAAIMNRGRIIAEDTPSGLLDWFSKGSEIVFRVAGDAEIIEKEPWIIGKGSTVFREENGTSRIVVWNMSDDEIAKMNASLVKEGLRVFEIKRGKPQLEEVFISLVNGEKKCDK